MSAKPASKFTFDKVFTGTAGLSAEAAAARPKTYSSGEVDAMCVAARSEGTQTAEARAASDLATAAERAATCVVEALHFAEAQVDVIRAEAAQLALAFARKLAHAALAELPVAEVESVLREAMHQAIGEPKIALKADARVIDELRARIEAIAHEEGFEGRVHLSADPTQHAADCRIEWRGGGAERHLEAIDEQLSALVARRFSHITPSSGV
jgi:flagellar assembly protein FliH